MKNRYATSFTAALVLLFTVCAFSQTPYFPEKGEWLRKTPAEQGFDASRLAAAIRAAKDAESKAPRDQALGQAQTFGREPFGGAVGPFKARGEMTGIIVSRGYIIAEWGEPDRVDMAHSVTKSFITAVIGLGFDSGAISDLDAPVHLSMAPVSPLASYKDFDRADAFGKSGFLELFEGEHNRKITWDHLLRQTSDWQGTLWDKPDWADRPDRDSSTWLTRTRNEPGSVYEYNDVRVNLLALAALNVIRKPLPEVLREQVMDPIGASATWRWHGYENSFVLIDGRPVQSVSGGGHWGGGMFISARDMARFGLLIARRGKWNGRQIISERFLSRAEIPTNAQTTYGYMNFFLNTDRKLYPGAPEGTIAFLGNGTNIVYIDRNADLVVVVRWIESNRIDAFLTAVYECINNTSRRSL